MAQRVIDLEQVLRAFAPERDWTWLRRLARRLTRAARPLRDKRASIRPTDELCAAGGRLMARAEAGIGEDLKRRAAVYRDGLMVALLARRPFRLTNFVSIRIGRHLRRVGSGWIIVFEEDETKTRTCIELPFPDDLVGALERYLGHWRRALLGEGDSDHLWISARSVPFRPHGARLRIRRATEKCLGVRLWPHLFRHCLATHIANRDPERVGIAGVLLGHRHDGTKDRHYIIADQRLAAQRWQADVLGRRRAAKRRRGSD